jgi:DNA-binding transcriptional LysR family regulator
MEETVALQGRIRTTAAEAVREAVFADFGLAVASEAMFSPELANGTVTQTLPDWSLPPIDLWAVFPSRRRATAKARAFVAFVETTMDRSQQMRALKPALVRYAPTTA